MRIIGKLKALNVGRMKQPGLQADGGGLYLQVKNASSKSWLFRYFVGERDPATGEPVRNAVGRMKGRTREMGLGSFANVNLEEARRRAAECRRLREHDIDPLEQQEKARRQAALDKAQAVKFRDAAQLCLEAHRPSWRSSKHATQWAATLKTYAYPIIGDLPVQTVDTQLVLRILKPLWDAKRETASRLRGRIETVLDWATANNYRQGENPARWKGHLENLLSKRSKARSVKHLAALRYAELPAFITALREQDSVAARALEFTILAAARTGETLGARWSEIDLAGKVWTIAGARMKAGKDHRVPLSKRALQVLAGLDRTEGGFVFSAGVAGKPLGGMAMLRALARMGRADLTVHGFRSSFTDWAAERTKFSAEVCEMALAHAIPSAVRKAYRRGDDLDKRRQLMDRWDQFCSSPPAAMGEVIPLHASRATTSL